jgi:hypothetical protein
MIGKSQPLHDTYATAGFLAGLIVAGVLWFFPIPVALVVWLFGLKGLFADYMYMAIPVFLALPFLGAVLGSLVNRSSGSTA